MPKPIVVCCVQFGIEATIREFLMICFNLGRFWEIGGWQCTTPFSNSFGVIMW
jgi:hypothetical protein